jgi:hypothetical protein
MTRGAFAMRKERLINHEAFPGSLMKKIDSVRGAGCVLSLPPERIRLFEDRGMGLREVLA